MLSGLVAALVYWWTLTMFSNSSSFRHKIGVFSTRRFCLFVALLCAVVAHISEDFIFDFF